MIKEKASKVFKWPLPSPEELRERRGVGAHKIGFSGTQKGMNQKQKQAFDAIIAKIQPDEFHHGKCIGADEDAHHIVRETSPGTKIHGHPCTITDKQVNLQVDVNHPVKEPIPRNHDIVDQTDYLIAAPKSRLEELRSGTWSTIRYARKQGKRVTILYP